MTDETLPPLLKARGISVHFGGVKAVDGVDFTLGERELRCLIGPNGAGKSTFFRCLTKQYQPTSGRMEFLSQDITRAQSHDVARLGMGIKTQVPNVFDGLTVRENMSLAACARHRGRALAEACDRAIERLDLTGIVDERLDRLSHGQRQWVELAMIVTSRPRLILLDEPTAGMTQAEVERTAALIRELHREAAMVVVEHDMQFVRSIASRVTVFHQGRIFAEDTADRIMKNEAVGEIYLGKRNLIK